MRRLKTIPFLRHNKAVEYTISALIITVVTVILVLVAFVYAYQVLDVQRGSSEFQVAQKSLLAFDDALESVAWKPGATRSTSFTVQYGYLQLSPSTNAITISAIVNSQSKLLSNASYPGMTGLIQYWLSNKYVTFGNGYQSYILGNSSSVISTSSGTYGRAVINQQSSMISISLDTRVRVMKTSVMTINGVTTNYVDIWVIKLDMLVPHAWSYVNQFNLEAKTLSVRTASFSYPVTNQTSLVSVQIGTAPANQVPIALTISGSSQVVFNVVLSDVQVTV